MLVIRLTRVGKKKQPSYRIVVQEKARDPWSDHIEKIGHYNPLTNPATLVLKEDRLQYWVGKGAQPSDSLWNIFVDRGLLKGEKRRIVQHSKKRQEKMKAAKVEAPAAAA